MQYLKLNDKNQSFMAELLTDSCDKNCATLLMGPKTGESGQITFRDKFKVVSFFNCCFDVNPFGSSMVARNKGLVRLILEKENIKLPKGKYFLLHADEYAHLDIQGLNAVIFDYAKNSLGFPLMVKGADLHRGLCVSKVDSEKELAIAIANVWNKTNGVVIEEYKKLKDYRFLIFDQKIIAAYRKDPLGIVGDGMSSVEQLVNKAKLDNKKVNIGNALETMEDKIYFNLAKLGIGRNNIMSSGKRVDLLEVCNISTGGTPVDCTEFIHEDFHEYCRKIMKILNLKFAGIDILSVDISLSPKESYILEVNASPDLEGYAKIGDIQFEKIRKLVDDIVATMGIK